MGLETGGGRALVILDYGSGAEVDERALRTNQESERRSDTVCCSTIGTENVKKTCGHGKERMGGNSTRRPRGLHITTTKHEHGHHTWPRRSFGQGPHPASCSRTRVPARSPETQVAGPTPERVSSRASQLDSDDRDSSASARAPHAHAEAASGAMCGVALAVPRPADATAVDGEATGDGQVHAMVGRRDDQAGEKRRDGGGN
ncbi:hypothetical protein C8Q80DRAFT_154279 [Daedaleopsis nitida]|nr:hypothetical protein C8Q80DRAFT_154279 [Daedaleopsis nitida]